TMSTNRTLAGPPGDCCFKSFRHEGTPLGTKTTIADIPTYVSEPPSNDNSTSDKSRRIIIFLSDIFGPFYQNNMLLQDSLAQNGFTVLGVDYFLGDAVYHHLDKPGFDRMAWIAEMHKIAQEVTPKWWAAVKAKYGEARYCISGYCFGASYTMDIANSEDVVVATSLAHPAFLNEEHFRKIKKPLMISCAEIDHTFPAKERRIAEDIVTQQKAQYYFQIFSGVEHGFSARGDPSVGDSRWAKEQSAQGISLWFHRFYNELEQQSGNKV
ncbi:hypothetical protein GYMLUDRAFT_168638, partial [Collybiopsis luxurians FD-317 M1]